jgi:radical SAM superfamily enzyme YgiQ (UPF0313 family)
MLSLLAVAALSPKDSCIRIIDEQIEEVPFDEHFDVVGITFMTAVAPRAYEISRVFRAKGIRVVFGGFHTTLNPDETTQHADAIVVGSASGAWENQLRDLEAGELRKIYYGDLDPHIPAELPRYLLNKSNYITMNATHTTLGYESHCQFCSISAFYQGKRHERDIDEVIREISNFRESFFMFVDDNLTQDRSYIYRLLERLIPLKKKWGTQASIDIAGDDELLRLLRDTGCVGLFIGLETFSEKALEEQEKRFNTPRHYRDAIDRIHSCGMFVEAGIMFGFDHDSPDVFQKT